MNLSKILNYDITKLFKKKRKRYVFIDNIHSHDRLFNYDELFKKCFSISVKKLSKVGLNTTSETDVYKLVDNWYTKKLKYPELYEDLMELYVYCLMDTSIAFFSSQRIHQSVVFKAITEYGLMNETGFFKEFIKIVYKAPTLTIKADFFHHITSPSNLNLSEHFQVKLLELDYQLSGNIDKSILFKLIKSPRIYDDLIRGKFSPLYIQPNMLLETSTEMNNFIEAISRIGKRKLPVLLGKGELIDEFVMLYMNTDLSRANEISKIVASNLSKDINYYDTIGVYGLHRFISHFKFDYDRVKEFVEKYSINLKFFDISEFTVNEKIDLIDIHHQNKKEEMYVKYSVMFD